MRFNSAPTGKAIEGHVLDCAKRPFLEALRLYDPLLYVKWNPKKCRGWGCWEVRRRPEEKTIRPEDVTVWRGNTIVCPKYHENNLTHHVLDIPYLNYRVLEKLKSMDMWEQKDMGYKAKNLNSVIEYNEAKFDEKTEDKALSELKYNLKQQKSQIRWLKDYVNSGGNPYRLADHWK